MSEPTLHLVRIPLRADRFAAIAKRRGISPRNLDDGYLTHSLFTEVWQGSAPAPFVLRGRGRVIDIWGYSATDAAGLIEHARAFGDPSIVNSFDDLDAIASRPMPRLREGTRVGFLVRVCPVVRIARDVNGHRAGAEVDAFLARCFSAGTEKAVSREDTYLEWFRRRLADGAMSGVTLVRVGIAAIARTRLTRRTQGSAREAKTLERPDVRVEGDMVIENGDTFLRFLARGVGRHRAFGFGAIMVVPPGTTHARA